jgi:hypothetical protein
MTRYQTFLLKLSGLGERLWRRLRGKKTKSHPINALHTRWRPPSIPRLPRSLYRCWLRGIEHLADLTLGIATAIPECPDLPDPRARNARYDPLDYRALKIIAKRAPPRPDEVAYDLGCGMGRMICFFARRPAKLCVGVEMAAELAEMARRNAITLIGRRAPIEIYTADAAQIDLANATLIGMYNPFGEEVLRTVMENLCASLQTNARRVRIFYANPHHYKVMSEYPVFRQIDQFLVPCKLIKFDVMVWENVSARPDSFPHPIMM